MFLTDLTFIDSNPDRIDSAEVKDGLINFSKLRKTAEVIKHIQHFQLTGYNEVAVPIIRDFLFQAAIKNFSEDEAYKVSLVLEPRT